MDRVGYEVNSIGATGVKPPLPGRTSVCIGGRIDQPAQKQFMIGSDYAGFPSSIPCPFM
jgi:hypothetical protein